MNADYQYLYKVYEEGSFSKAAAALYLTQPALSIAIQRIETEIGMPLFDRASHPLKLTEAGEIYIKTIRRIKELEKNLENEINDILDLKTGVLHIGAGHFTYSYVLPGILSGFIKKYPGIQLMIHEGPGDAMLDMISEHSLDLMFTCNPAHLSRFPKKKAFTDRILLAVPETIALEGDLERSALSAQDIIERKHFAADVKTFPLSLFRDIPFILITAGNDLHKRSMNMFHEAGFTPNVRMQLDQTATAFHLCEGGIAASFVSDRLIIHKDCPLRFYVLDSKEIDRQFYMLLPNTRYYPHLTETFVSFFQERQDEREK